MENNFEKLQHYISKYWNCSLAEIKPNTSLDELGMLGDDKTDFLKDYSKNFKVYISGLDSDKYIEYEPDISLFIDNIYHLFLKKDIPQNLTKKLLQFLCLRKG